MMTVDLKYGTVYTRVQCFVCTYPEYPTVSAAFRLDPTAGNSALVVKGASGNRSGG